MGRGRCDPFLPRCVQASGGLSAEAMGYFGYAIDRAENGTPTVEELANEIAVPDKDRIRLKMLCGQNSMRPYEGNQVTK